MLESKEGAPNMDHEQIQDPAAAIAPMPLTYAWGAYFAAASLLWVCFAFSAWGFATAVYIVAGFVLTRLVTRRLVVMHPIYDTIANEFSMKFRLFIFWPLQMLLLLLKMSINRML